MVVFFNIPSKTSKAPYLSHTFRIASKYPGTAGTQPRV